MSGVSTLSNDSKMVLVLAMSEAVNTSNEELLAAAINDINILPVIIMRVIQTASDDSTLKQDIEIAFHDVISKTYSFISYSIGDIIEFLVDYNLTSV